MYTRGLATPWVGNPVTHLLRPSCRTWVGNPVTFGGGGLWKEGLERRVDVYPSQYCHEDEDDFQNEISSQHCREDEDDVQNEIFAGRRGQASDSVCHGRRNFAE